MGEDNEPVAAVNERGAAHVQILAPRSIAENHDLVMAIAPLRALEQDQVVAVDQFFVIEIAQQRFDGGCCVTGDTSGFRT